MGVNMDLGKAQMSYDNQEPSFEDVSQKVEEYTAMYYLRIRHAIRSGKEYEYINVLGDEKQNCPAQEITEDLWTHPEKCRQVITGCVNGLPDDEIGKMFKELVESVIKKTAIDLAEDQVTAEED
jgi:hypothetical protein